MDVFSYFRDDDFGDDDFGDDDFPSSPYASSQEDLSSSDQETDQSVSETQTWSGNPRRNTTTTVQRQGPSEPQASARSLLGSRLHHDAQSHTTPNATHNTTPFQTIPPFRASNIPPYSRPRSRPLPDFSDPLFGVPSSHLRLPSPGIFEDRQAQSPAGSSSSSNTRPGSWRPLSQSEVVDLTGEPSPPIMAPTTRTKRKASGTALSDGPSTAESSTKRRKTAIGAKHVKKESDPAEIDLTEVNDSNDLARVLEAQQENAIKAQREDQGDEPVLLSGLQCVVCLETMTDITVTACGHLFCHTCLFEALVAGELQEHDNGKSYPRCPVCRKRVVRQKAGRDKLGKENQGVIPVEVKLLAKGKMAKRKDKVGRGSK